MLYISLNVAPPPSLGHHGGVQGAKIVIISETAKKNDKNLKKRPSEFGRSKLVAKRKYKETITVHKESLLCKVTQEEVATIVLKTRN